ncbi:hypothetical protein H310_09265 [Aphanomyces invadans]|uniref:FYVE-type domain-containing protein n=1 Tax=Aphanomyces invadans TaxID=157072 RepID=A0A024TWG5_9STRA|nr:hypothetical protein H310_09265 [Aphanomyces invadans]ETV97951.1 hypothetical protein H310_09265 [Aphanomyces invadans]|eukprot:XP_008873512.1 hypothetical protein H310_09265 [Aphanomyces invadans]
MASKTSHCNLCTKRFTLLRRRHLCSTCCQDFCKTCTYTSLRRNSSRLCTPCVMRMHPPPSSQAYEIIFHSTRTLESSRQNVMTLGPDNHRPAFLSHPFLSAIHNSTESTKSRASSSGTSVTAIMDDEEPTNRSHTLVAMPEHQVVEHPHVHPPHRARPRRSISVRPSRLLLTPRQRVDVRARAAAAVA